jgi:hypothetical protein
MIRRLIAVVFVIVLGTGAVAQDQAADSVAKGWNLGLIADLTITQAAYSDSWTGGEAGSFNWVANMNGSAERQIHPSWNLRSTLKLAFGQTLTQDNETKDWSKPQKSTDRIDWENVARMTRGWEADPYAAFRLESQFADASNPDKRLLFTPVKLTESVGLSYKHPLREESFVMTRLGAAVRQIFTRSADTSLTVFDTTVIDGGVESVTDVELNFGERLTYIGKLTLYKAFYNSEDDELTGDNADDWKAVDVDWENTIAASVTKILSVKLYTQILYDKEISHKGRFKETLGLSFVFKLI